MAALVPIQTITLATAAASVTFSSLPQEYGEMIVKMFPIGPSSINTRVGYGSTSSINMYRSSTGGALSDQYSVVSYSHIDLRMALILEPYQEITLFNYSSTTGKSWLATTSAYSTAANASISSSFNSSSAATTSVSFYAYSGTSATTSTFSAGSRFELYGVAK